MRLSAVLAAIAFVLVMGGCAPAASSNSEPVTPATALQRSGTTGLLGAPLPVGATLTERRPGDSASGADPAEQYAIAASAAEIAAFFDTAMPAAGWVKAADSTATSMYFEKGSVVIGVIMNSSGDSFTLMGS
jgi:hypothetical protein